MARFYANENFPRQAVNELRGLGHDVLTSLEAGNANRSVPDEEVLGFAARERRVLPPRTATLSATPPQWRDSACRHRDLHL